MDPVELTRLRTLFRSLSARPNVYGAVALATSATMEEHVHALVRQAETDWARVAVKGAVGPRSSADIAAALHPVDAETAVEFMTNLSAFDLAYGGPLRDRDHARRAATTTAELLGYRTQWWSNTDGPWHSGRGWDPVSRHTFDGVVAGVSDDYVVALLQVAED